MITPQLVLHLHLEEAKKKPKISGNYLVTEKKDGIYAIIDYSVDTGWDYIYSRQGRKIPAFFWTKEFFNNTLTKPSVNCRLIMEATIDGKEFHESAGIFNRSDKKTDFQAYDAIFNLHDIILTDTFHVDTAENYALNRWNLLQALDISKCENKIRKIPLLTISDDKKVWMKYFNEIVEAGGEGIVLKATNSLYQPDKRNSSLMKIKLETNAFLHCVGMYRTVGEKGNSNLNLTLRSKAGHNIEVRVGRHEDIARFENDSSTVLDKVVEIKAMCKLESGQYREPRLLHVRYDKDLKAID